MGEIEWQHNKTDNTDMALNLMAQRVRERYILAYGYFFGYLLSFLDTRSQITGTIAFMREKTSQEFVIGLFLYFAVSILWMLLRKSSPLSLVICMLPQWVYVGMGTWWLIATQNSSVQAPYTAFGVHFGFAIVSFGLVFWRLQSMAKGYSLDDTILPGTNRLNETL